MFEIICQIPPPASDLNGDWEKYIIMGLVSFIGVLLGFIVKMFSKVDATTERFFKKADEVVDKFQEMHNEGIDKINTSIQNQNTLLQNQNAELEILKVHSSETKQALLRIDCVNEDIQPKRKAG